MAPGNIDPKDTTRNVNANYNRDKPKKPFLRMSTSMQNKIDNPSAEPGEEFSMDLLDDAQKARLQRAFGIFDKDDSGKISHTEMMGVRPPFRPLHRMTCASAPGAASLAGPAVTREQSDQRRVGGHHPSDRPEQRRLHRLRRVRARLVGPRATAT